MKRDARETIRRRDDYERDPEWGERGLFPSRKKTAKRSKEHMDRDEVFREEFEEERIPPKF